MNVVYIINQLRRSGPVYVLYNIIANLDREIYNPIVIKLMADDPQRSFTYKFQELGIEIVELNLSFWELELRTKHVALKIDNLLSNRNVKIINTHGYHPLLVSSYMNIPIQRIDTLHCISIDSFRSSRGWFIGTYMHLRYLYHIKQIECRVGISDTVTNYYNTILKNDKACTIYNGIDTDIFDLKRKSKNDLKTKLGLNHYDKVFVVVGHLNPLKDPVTVIKSYISLIDNGELADSCLIFCGTGILLEKCKQIAKKYPMIKFTGFVNNVHEYLLAADYSICASHSEGFGQNFIEALICGCVVISSKIPVFCEFISYYPQLGKLQFDVSDEKGLSCAIRNAVCNNFDVNIMRNDAISRFSAKKMSANYMHLYNQLIFNKL